MKLKQYLEGEGRGSRSRLASKIGVSLTEISYWSNEIRLPPLHRCLDIEIATNGIVTRKDLRPDDWFKYWA